jgi:hypothetical protein
LWRIRAVELGANLLGRDDVALALEASEGLFFQSDRLGFAAGAPDNARQINEDPALPVEVVRLLHRPKGIACELLGLDELAGGSETRRAKVSPRDLGRDIQRPRQLLADPRQLRCFLVPPPLTAVVRRYACGRIDSSAASAKVDSL